MNIRKRYSEFDGFRHQLIRTFPNFEAAVPTLPPKSVISKFRPRFLEKRRAGLQYFLKYVSHIHMKAIRPSIHPLTSSHSLTGGLTLDTNRSLLAVFY